MRYPPGNLRPQIPARYYARMAELMQQQGIDIAALLRRAQVQPSELTRSDALLRLDQVERLVEAAWEIAGRSDLALDLGRALKPSAHSIVGYGMLSSPTVGYALHLVARFFRLVMPTFSMRYRLDDRQMEAVFTPIASMSRLCLSFHIEAIAWAAHWEVRELLQGNMPRYDLYLSIPEPPHAARYAELLEARCHFGWDMRPGLRMITPASVAASPLALADSAALQMAEERSAALVRQAVASRQVSDWVRMMIREAAGGMPTLNELAHTLNLSQRTLDRYLRKEGPGFRELSKLGRHEKARDLLADSALSVTQIAYELGYADAANFTRAFRQLAGLSPSRYRENHRVSDSGEIGNSQRR